jgi:hypothetical protein
VIMGSMVYSEFCAEQLKDEVRLPLGVVWSLVQDEIKGNDGGHTGYLNLRGGVDEWGACGSDLYDFLKKTLAVRSQYSGSE